VLPKVAVGPGTQVVAVDCGVRVVVASGVLLAAGVAVRVAVGVALGLARTLSEEIVLSDTRLSVREESLAVNFSLIPW